MKLYFNVQMFHCTHSGYFFIVVTVSMSRQSIYHLEEM